MNKKKIIIIIISILVIVSIIIALFFIYNKKDTTKTCLEDYIKNYEKEKVKRNNINCYKIEEEYNQIRYQCDYDAIPSEGERQSYSKIFINVDNTYEEDYFGKITCE